MRRLLFALPVLLAAGCTTTGTTVYAPLRAVAYQALGHQPAWHLVIGDDRIVFGPVAGGGDRSWPRVLPRTVDGVHTWQSGSGADGITIIAREGPCGDDPGVEGQETMYEDHVTVRFGTDGPELNGCGGHILSGRRDG